nr:hypothetical protein GCM10025732_37400 [Glycomyces mayteni]
MSPAVAADTTSAHVGGSPPIQPSSVAVDSATASTDPASPNATGSDDTYPAVASLDVIHDAHTCASGAHAIGRFPNDIAFHDPVIPRDASAADTSVTSTPTHSPFSSGCSRSHSCAASPKDPNTLGAAATVTRYTSPEQPDRNNATKPHVNPDATSTDTNVITIHGATGIFWPPFLRRRPVRWDLTLCSMPKTMRFTPGGIVGSQSRARTSKARPQ